MRFLTRGLLLSLAILIFLPVYTNAGVPDNSECDKVQDADRRNICMALMNDRNEGNPLDKNRYQNKDHSSYYCSLIKSRDLKNLCHAQIENNKARCDLIGSKEITEECLSSVK